MNMDTVAKTVQVLSVVVGVVISVLSFNTTRQKELEAAKKNVEARQLEAAKPFLELRQKLYMEVVKAAAVLSTPGERSKEEMSTARRRFRELYVAELSMVEPSEVEGQMVKLAKIIDPELIPLSAAQQAAYDLAHSLRNSFVAGWGVDQEHGRQAALAVGR